MPGTVSLIGLRNAAQRGEDVNERVVALCDEAMRLRSENKRLRSAYANALARQLVEWLEEDPDHVHLLPIEHRRRLRDHLTA